jgi:hypothetical protein
LIVHQLQKILAHPQLQSLTETQNIYRRLIMHWQIVSSEVNAQRNTREQLSNVFH